MTMTALLRADGRVVHFAPTDGPERITFVDPQSDRPGEVDVETVTAHLSRQAFAADNHSRPDRWAVQQVDVVGTHIIDGAVSGLRFRAEFYPNDVPGRRWHLRDLPPRLVALIADERDIHPLAPVSSEVAELREEVAHLRRAVHAAASSSSPRKPDWAEDGRVGWLLVMGHDVERDDTGVGAPTFRLGDDTLTADQVRRLRDALTAALDGVSETVE